MKYICPVCGYPELKRDPHYIASFEICPSCNFQFRVDDDDKGFTYAQWRKEWIEAEMRWNEGNSKPPEGWNPVEQLENLALIPKSD